MRRPVTMPRSVVLLALAVALTASPARACSCTNELTLEQEFGYADAVFSGRVLSIVPDTYIGQLRVELEPLARWKGGIDQIVNVLTPIDEAGCGFPFAEGVEYLVFGSGPGGDVPYFTHLCAKTGPLIGNPYVSQLGPPLVPTGIRAPSWGALKRFYR